MPTFRWFGIVSVEGRRLCERNPRQRHEAATADFETGKQYSKSAATLLYRLSQAAPENLRYYWLRGLYGRLNSRRVDLRKMYGAARDRLDNVTVHEERLSADGRCLCLSFLPPQLE
jgi:hypothetical protein